MKKYVREVSIGKLHTICLPCNARPAEGISLYSIVGRSTDSCLVFLRGAYEMKAGKAYLFCSTRRRVTFYCDEFSVSSPDKDTPLQGTFLSCPVLPPHSYILYDDSWYIAGNKVSITSYSAFLNLDALPFSTTGLAMNVYNFELL